MINKQGRCPFCNGSNLDYGKINLKGKKAYFSWQCQDCHRKGEEWFSMLFAGHNIVTDNGEKVTLEFPKEEQSLELVNTLPSSTIDMLYAMNCVKASASGSMITLSDEELIEYTHTLDELFCKDETNTSISMLSDLLFKYKDSFNDDMTTREKLSVFEERGEI